MQDPQIISVILYFHIVAGALALITGLMAIFSSKGRKVHKRSGKVYFWAMTLVFITGLIIAGFRYNRFLFLIAFISYYSVFSGYRSLKLKKLHLSQSPGWQDWAAGIINTLANLVFVGLGLYYFALKGISGASVLTLGFGSGGLLLSYTNLKPFLKKPDKSFHWYMSHIGNMMGGYIATTTAFLSTMVTRFDLMNPFLAFALPSLIGIPLLFFWQHREEKKFTGI
ncbi:MAG: hypothetical protein ACNS62_12540 [Candidatus Cyclobacteriaceae bacterium M3_2C_046]